MDGLCCCLSKPCVKVERPNIGLGKDKWEIPRKELRTADLLGSGNFGEVYKGYWNRTTVVAIKTLKANASDVGQFLREAQIMKTMIHPKLMN